MARREKTFKKPSYRVFKRKKERDMRMKMGYEPRFHNLPGQIPVFWGNIEGTRTKTKNHFIRSLSSIFG
jgi:hypothetical protein